MLRRLFVEHGQRLRWNVHPQFSLVGLRGLKQTTGIVGIDVDPNARENLKAKLQEVLEAVKVIPEDAEYRRSVEVTFQHRLTAAESSASDEELEEQFNLQLEEMIIDVDKEMGLIPKMAVWKPWDVPPGHKVEIIAEQDLAEKLNT